MKYKGDKMEFCSRAENLVGLLIRARRYDTPDFMSEECLKAWRISVDEPRQSSRNYYLRLATTVYDQLCFNMDDVSIAAADSDIPVEERSPEFLVHGLFHVEELNNAITAGNALVDWDQVVDWGSLPYIRQKINTLRDASTAESTSWRSGKWISSATGDRLNAHTLDERAKREARIKRQKHGRLWEYDVHSVADVYPDYADKIRAALENKQED